MKVPACQMRQASDEGVEFLSQWEGLRLKAYYDPAGYLTLGVGHLLSKDELSSGKVWLDGGAVRWGEGISKSQALLLLSQDLDEVEGVLSLDRYSLTITQHAFDAICSLAFNIGTGAFRNSTLRKKLLAGNLEGARDQFGRWTYSGGGVIPGLVKRRAAEALLFWEGVYSAP